MSEGMPEAGSDATVTQTGEEYTTQGRTTVATRRGYAFNPSNKSLPTITSAGVNMTADEADEVIAEAETAGIPDLVSKVQTEKED